MSNRTKRGLLFVSSALVISLAAFCTYRIARTSPVVFRPEDFRRIADNMTEREVEQTLGYPPGDYCTDPDISETFHTYYIEDSLIELPHKEWLSDEGMIQI